MCLGSNPLTLCPLYVSFWSRGEISLATTRTLVILQSNRCTFDTQETADLVTSPFSRSLEYFPDLSSGKYLYSRYSEIWVTMLASLARF